VIIWRGSYLRHLSQALSAVSGVPSVAMPVFVGLVPPVPAKRAGSQLMPVPKSAVLHSFVSFKIGETGETMRQSLDLQTLSAAALAVRGGTGWDTRTVPARVCIYFLIPSRLSTFACHFLPVGTA
jgi:hypothetical protein